MSRVGELLELLRTEMFENHPRKPIRIVVGRTKTFMDLSTEPDYQSNISIPPGGGGRLFAGVPIFAASGTDRDFDFRIEFEEAR